MRLEIFTLLYNIDTLQITYYAKITNDTALYTSLQQYKLLIHYETKKKKKRKNKPAQYLTISYMLQLVHH